MAIKTRDPSVPKTIYDDKELGWLCKKCPYLNKCIAMRNVKDEEALNYLSEYNSTRRCSRCDSRIGLTSLIYTEFE